MKPQFHAHFHIESVFEWHKEKERYNNTMKEEIKNATKRKRNLIKII